MMKSGVRILALDDSRFSKRNKRNLVLGIIGREGEVEGAIAFNITVDGSDSADRLISRMKRSRFLSQIRLIALQGITFAGLNLVDVLKVNKELRVPVVAITRKKPHSSRLIKAMKAAGIGDFDKRKSLLKNISKKTVSAVKNGFYLQYTKDISSSEIESILPHALSLLRLTHIIVGGIVKGESKGR